MPPVVTSIRRYPVKAMGGEQLERADLDERGLVGDRWWAVVDGDGRLASGKDSRRFRRRDAVLAHAARTDASGGVLVTGPDGELPLGADLDRRLSDLLGDPVQVRAEATTSHQDGGPVSLVGTATLRWCAERWGVDADPRRLRVNLLVETEEPFVEESWVGSTVSVGSVRLVLVEPVPRCRTIDLAQDGVATTERWLLPLGRERDACLAVYADVVVPGTVAVGDAVVLRPAEPAQLST